MKMHVAGGRSAAVVALALALAPPAPAAPPAAPTKPRLMTPADLDREIEAMWAAARVKPAPAADDAEWFRRVTLDLVGRIPTLGEVEAFLADRAPDRRAKAVDRLLATTDYAEHWADVFMDLFVGRQFRKPKLERELDPRAYFAAAVRDGVPYDRMVTDMLTFTGEILPNGPGVFLASHLKGGGPEAIASATARLFLGLQIQCAQCHDHPTDPRYKQDDFYGLAAYFARTRYKQENPGKKAKAAKETTADATMTSAMPAAADTMKAAAGKHFYILDKPKGEATFRRSGTTADVVAAPRFLGRALEPGATPRETLARAVVTSDLFAKAAVDRVWAQLFGRGIVEPWDDLGGEADPGHPALLRRLADDFRAGGHDLRRLLRLLVSSRAYGLTSRGTPAAPAASFARATVRRLTPEQLFRSLHVATGVAADDKKLERLLREYLFVFGDDEGAEVNALAGNVPQALLLWNGEVTNQGSRGRDGTLGAILSASPDPAARLRRIFLTAYGRPATDAEGAQLLPRLRRTADYEDLFFALLTSTEMASNH